MSQSEAALTHARPIALCEPRIQGNEIHYLEKCIRENWVSSAGPYVDAFERSLAELAGSKHAVSTSSGTAAIHLGLLLAGIQPDEEVIVPSLTFIAPANAVRYLGAWPTFLDVEPRYWQIDPAAVERFLREDCQRSSDGCLRNRHTGRVVRCLLAVHLLGHPCEMDSLLSLCAEFGLFLLEDATESLGARYRESPVGSHGQLACFSFNGNKIVTTGGGGMLVTNDDHLAERARYLSTQAKDDPLEYVHNEVGYNYRLTSLQAAFGLAQLEQLEGFITSKRRINRTYRAGLGDLPGVSFQEEAQTAFSTFWLSTILIDPDKFGSDRRHVLQQLAQKGIQARPLWQPLHLSPAHQKSWCGGAPVAEGLNSLALSLPSSAGLTEDQQAYCIERIRELAR